MSNIHWRYEGTVLNLEEAHTSVNVLSNLLTNFTSLKGITT